MAATDAPRCVICGGALQHWAVVDSYRIDRCVHCGHALVNPRPTAAELRIFYETAGGHPGQAPLSIDQVLEREQSFPNSSVDAERMISSIVRLTTKRGRLLDVGCGYGFFSKRARDQGFEVDALEIAPFERDCAAKLAGVNPIPIPFEDYDSRGNQYDAVLMSQVLEHAADVNQWVQKAWCLLRAGGVLCVAVPNFGGLMRQVLGRRDPYVTPPAHLNYFTKQSLVILLEKHQFRAEPVRTISRIPYDALSKRLSRAPYLSRPLTYLMANLQTVPLNLVDKANMGMFLNAYGVRRI